MTNEEAIRILGRMLDEFCNEDSYAPECKDAVDMAIEALKEQQEHSQNTSSKQPDLDTLGIKTGETCEDVISRRDAIDAMTNTLWHYPNECYRNLNEYEFAKGLAELGLKSVPSAQPEYEELTPEEAASEIASGSTMSAWYWLDDMIRLKQMGYAICRKENR